MLGIFKGRRFRTAQHTAKGVVAYEESVGLNGLGSRCGYMPHCARHLATYGLIHSGSHIQRYAQMLETEKLDRVLILFLAFVDTSVQGSPTNMTRQHLACTDLMRVLCVLYGLTVLA